MPKYKSLLVGHEVVNAGKARNCRHNGNHRIVKGEVLLHVRDGIAWRGYCGQCVSEMVRQARMALDEIERRLA